MALINIEQAAAHLKASLADPLFLEEIEPKMDQATAIVIRYIKRPDHTWTANTDASTDYEFAIVQAAILKVLGNLYAFRGDEQPNVSPLSPDVVSVLSMVRDPSLA